jgi:APA family basic amino acid/polyamine antiporter
MAAAAIPSAAGPPRAGVGQAGAGLGLGACIALVVGNMIGSGVFLLPAALAGFGAIAIGGWVLTSVGALILALIFGRLARLVTHTGGPYAYAREGFGEFAGFLIAWGYWIALWAGNAGVALALAGYVGHFVPAVSQSETYTLAVALLAIWVLTFVNVRGVQEASLVQMVTTVLKLLPLLAIAFIGLLWLDAGNFTPVNKSDHGAMGALAATAALTLWAFLGLESATVPSGEVKNPTRTIPLATILGVLIASTVYIMVTVVAIGVMPSADLAASSAPLADVASLMWGSWAGSAVALGAIIATIGTLNGFTLLCGQVPYGAATDHIFPSALGKLSRFGTPANALVLSNLLASLLIVVNLHRGLIETFTLITLLASATTLVPYAICSVAELMIYLRRGTTIAAGAGLWKVIALGAAGFAYAFGALFGAGMETIFWGFLLLVAGVPIHVAIKFANRPRQTGG